jgi:hypothetical protein
VPSLPGQTTGRPVTGSSAASPRCAGTIGELGSMAGTAPAFGEPRPPMPSRYGPRAAVELWFRAPPATVAGWAFEPLIGMPCGRTGRSSSRSALATTLTRSCSTPG